MRILRRLIIDLSKTNIFSKREMNQTETTDTVDRGIVKISLKSQFEDAYSCDVCSMTFPQQAQIISHLRYHEKFACVARSEKLFGRSQINEQVPNHRREIYRCPKCGKKFITQFKLRRHLAAKHGRVNIKRKQNNSKISACPISNGFFDEDKRDIYFSRDASREGSNCESNRAIKKANFDLESCNKLICEVFGPKSRDKKEISDDFGSKNCDEMICEVSDSRNIDEKEISYGFESNINDEIIREVGNEKSCDAKKSGKNYTERKNVDIRPKKNYLSPRKCDISDLKGSYDFVEKNNGNIGNENDLAVINRVENNFVNIAPDKNCGDIAKTPPVVPPPRVSESRRCKTHIPWKIILSPFSGNPKKKSGKSIASLKRKEFEKIDQPPACISGNNLDDSCDGKNAVKSPTRILANNSDDHRNGKNTVQSLTRISEDNFYDRCESINVVQSPTLILEGNLVDACDSKNAQKIYEDMLKCCEEESGESRHVAKTKAFVAKSENSSTLREFSDCEHLSKFNNFSELKINSDDEKVIRDKLAGYKNNLYNSECDTISEDIITSHLKADESKNNPLKKRPKRIPRKSAKLDLVDDFDDLVLSPVTLESEKVKKYYDLVEVSVSDVDNSISIVDRNIALRSNSEIMNLQTDLSLDGDSSNIVSRENDCQVLEKRTNILNSLPRKRNPSLNSNITDISLRKDKKKRDSLKKRCTFAENRKIVAVSTVRNKNRSVSSSVKYMPFEETDLGINSRENICDIAENNSEIQSLRRSKRVLSSFVKDISFNEDGKKMYLHENGGEIAGNNNDIPSLRRSKRTLSLYVKDIAPSEDEKKIYFYENVGAIAEDNENVGDIAENNNEISSSCRSKRTLSLYGKDIAPSEDQKKIHSHENVGDIAENKNEISSLRRSKRTRSLYVKNIAPNKDEKEITSCENVSDVAGKTRSISASCNKKRSLNNINDILPHVNEKKVHSHEKICDIAETTKHISTARNKRLSLNDINDTLPRVNEKKADLNENICDTAQENKNIFTARKKRLSLNDINDISPHENYENTVASLKNVRDIAENKKFVSERKKRRSQTLNSANIVEKYYSIRKEFRTDAANESLQSPKRRKSITGYALSDSENSDNSRFQKVLQSFTRFRKNPEKNCASDEPITALSIENWNLRLKNKLKQNVPVQSLTNETAVNNFLPAEERFSASPVPLFVDASNAYNPCERLACDTNSNATNNFVNSDTLACDTNSNVTNNFANCDTLACDTNSNATNNFANSDTLACDTNSNVTNNFANSDTLACDTNSNATNNFANSDTLECDTNSNVSNHFANCGTLVCDTNSNVTNNFANCDTLACDTHSNATNHFANCDTLACDTHSNSVVDLNLMEVYNADRTDRDCNDFQISYVHFEIDSNDGVTSVENDGDVLENRASKVQTNCSSKVQENNHSDVQTNHASDVQTNSNYRVQENDYSDVQTGPASDVEANCASDVHMNNVSEVRVNDLGIVSNNHVVQKNTLNSVDCEVNLIQLNHNSYVEENDAINVSEDHTSNVTQNHASNVSENHASNVSEVHASNVLEDHDHDAQVNDFDEIQANGTSETNAILVSDLEITDKDWHLFEEENSKKNKDKSPNRNDQTSVSEPTGEEGNVKMNKHQNPYGQSCSQNASQPVPVKTNPKRTLRLPFKYQFLFSEEHMPIMRKKRNTLNKSVRKKSSSNVATMNGGKVSGEGTVATRGRLSQLKRAPRRNARNNGYRKKIGRKIIENKSNSTDLGKDKSDTGKNNDSINLNDVNSLSTSKPECCKSSNKENYKSEKVIEGKTAPKPQEGDSHACLFCDKTFTLFKDLKIHVKMHMQHRPYACKHCDKAFAKKIHLIAHQKSHENVKAFACKYCPRRFHFKSDHKNHERRHSFERNENCDICKKSFGLLSDLNRHMRRVHIGDTHKCEHCGQIFLDAPQKAFHVMLKHSERYDNNNNCLCCQKTFSDKSQLMKHMSEHVAQKQFACNICNRRFYRRNALKSHEDNHTTGKEVAIFECPSCDKKFRTKSWMERHMERAHTDLSENMAEKSSNIGITESSSKQTGEDFGNDSIKFEKSSSSAPDHVSEIIEKVVSASENVGESARNAHSVISGFKNASPATQVAKPKMKYNRKIVAAANNDSSAITDSKENGKIDKVEVVKIIKLKKSNRDGKITIKSPTQSVVSDLLKNEKSVEIKSEPEHNENAAFTMTRPQKNLKSKLNDACCDSFSTISETSNSNKNENENLENQSFSVVIYPFLNSIIAGSTRNTSESDPNTSESILNTSESILNTSESIPNTSESIPNSSESPNTSESIPNKSKDRIFKSKYSEISNLSSNDGEYLNKKLIERNAPIVKDLAVYEFTDDEENFNESNETSKLENIGSDEILSDDTSSNTVRSNKKIVSNYYPKNVCEANNDEIELSQCSGDLYQNDSDLNQNSSNLNRRGSDLYRSGSDLNRSGSDLNRSGSDLNRSETNIGKFKDIENRTKVPRSKENVTKHILKRTPYKNNPTDNEEVLRKERVKSDLPIVSPNKCDDSTKKATSDEQNPSETSEDNNDLLGALKDLLSIEEQNLILELRRDKKKSLENEDISTNLEVKKSLVPFINGKTIAPKPKRKYVRKLLPSPTKAVPEVNLNGDASQKSDNLIALPGTSLARINSENNSLRSSIGGNNTDIKPKRKYARKPFPSPTNSLQKIPESSNLPGTNESLVILNQNRTENSENLIGSEKCDVSRKDLTIPETNKITNNVKPKRKYVRKALPATGDAVRDVAKSSNSPEQYANLIKVFIPDTKNQVENKDEKKLLPAIAKQLSNSSPSNVAKSSNTPEIRENVVISNENSMENGKSLLECKVSDISEKIETSNQVNIKAKRKYVRKMVPPNASPAVSQNSNIPQKIDRLFARDRNPAENLKTTADNLKNSAENSKNSFERKNSEIGERDKRKLMRKPPQKNNRIAATSGVLYKKALNKPEIQPKTKRLQFITQSDDEDVSDSSNFSHNSKAGEANKFNNLEKTRQFIEASPSKKLNDNCISCKFCQEKFLRAKDVIRHCVSSHGKSIARECQICGEIFFEENSLKLHEQTHNQLPYECVSCEAAFSSMGELDSHMDGCAQANNF